MKNFFKQNWRYIVSFGIGIIIGILINLPTNNLEYQIQYIKIHNRLTITKDRIIEKTRIINIKDTLVKVDSVFLEKDGTFVELPMEYKIYRDTLKTDSTDVDITINYSGINPSIDAYNLDFIYDLKEITKIQPPKRFGIDIVFGLYFGYGVTGTTQNPLELSHGPEVGIGICIGPGYRITK